MKKSQNESGRSMVEMLGVLAIIGVLSVGAMAGYSAAMDRIQRNKIYKLIDTVAMAVAAESANGPDNLFTQNLSIKEKTKAFCDLYLPKSFCNEGHRLDPNAESFVLSERLFGDDSSAIYWRVATWKDGKSAYCFCDNDVSVRVGNLLQEDCNKLVDLVRTNYKDKGLIGFTGLDKVDVNADVNLIKNIICKKEKYNDFFAVFRGYLDDDTHCGKCHPRACPASINMYCEEE